MKHVKRNLLIAAAVSASLTTLTGCFNNNDNDNDNNDSEKVVSLLVADDSGNNAGVIRQFHLNTSQGLSIVQKKISVNLAEGIAEDAAGNIYQAGNGTNGGVVTTVCTPSGRGDTVALNSRRDRTIVSGLDSPKGIAVAQTAGYVIIAESGADTNAVSVFGASASNARTPLFSIPKAQVGGSGAWDVVYDEDSDKLFVALTNGSVAYYASYINRGLRGNSTPTAIFQPNNPLATGSNMHGIVYDAAADRLIVSDVAVPGTDDDGSLYVFEAASTLSGTVAPNRTIRGAATNLGNPVDLQLDGADLIVAEKANGGGRILVYNNIAVGDSGNIAPDADFLVAKPESIITKPMMQTATNDISDLNGEAIKRLHVTRNGGGASTQVFAIDEQLSAIGKSFTAVADAQLIESVSLDQNGDAIISFDNDGSLSPGGLSFVSRLADRSNAANLTGQLDRQISGDDVNLTSPKGVEVIGSKGLILVADLNAAAPGAIKAYSLCGADNSAPVSITTMPGSSRPWDMDYDPEADRLYVAATDGTIQVYDNYLSNTSAAPARTINPNDLSGFAASNIHGIVHDSVNNRLIVSDVGSASVANDGRIYVIDNADTADGLTNLKLELSGALTALGNPVDLAFDGTNLYVAEKSNNQLQRIDNIYSLNGSLNRAPDKVLTFSAPESIAISIK